MNKETFNAITARNKAIRAEIEHILSNAYGVEGVRDLERKTGANLNTIQDVLKRPDHYRGERPKTGRPSTGGMSGYELISWLDANVKTVKTKEVAQRIIEALTPIV